ncbi:MAG: hypothetical protein K0R26_1905 [Bacteroidota bacterium]|jgi:hypothetical protein|nr:hypothetical protein [Bacteroidota bacterium]
MADNTTTTTSSSALDALVVSLTASISTLSDAVTRTYAAVVLKEQKFNAAVAYEAEIDRQRMEKINDGDAYNADKLSDLLRNTVRPATQIAANELNAARAAYEAAKTALTTEKSKLSTVEQDLLAAKIAEATAAAQVSIANSNAEVASINSQSQAATQKAALETETVKGKLFTQKSVQIVTLIVVTAVLFIGGVVAYHKYIKK